MAQNKSKLLSYSHLPPKMAFPKVAKVQNLSMSGGFSRSLPPHSQAAPRAAGFCWRGEAREATAEPSKRRPGTDMLELPRELRARLMAWAARRVGFQTQISKAKPPKSHLRIWNGIREGEFWTKLRNKYHLLWRVLLVKFRIDV